jgi:RNA polymerase sigma-70 factor (ECF subfamily)
LLSACANIDKFQTGSKMIAWLLTILRNKYYSECRKHRREVEDIDGIYTELLTIEPDQIATLEYNELRSALAELPNDMRHALILVGAEGLSYQEAAQICGCAVGTIKSRVHRARARLAEALSINRSTGDTLTRARPNRPKQGFDARPYIGQHKGHCFAYEAFTANSGSTP